MLCALLSNEGKEIKLDEKNHQEKYEMPRHNTTSNCNKLPVQPAMALAGLNLEMSTRSPKSLSSGFVGFPGGTYEGADRE